MDLGLAGRRAIVTGGSKGLGKAIAAELLAEGASVAICSRQAGELQQAAAELAELARGATVPSRGIPPDPDGPTLPREGTSAGGKVTHQVCDVTEPEQVAAFVSDSAAALGGLDILVNNAGGARPGRFGTLSDADWLADTEVKLMSQIRCTRSALPYLRESSAPRVININAVYGRYPEPAFLASSVNRASCLSLSKALSIELGAEGIMVNSVNIGLVATPQWENIRRHRAPETAAADFFAQLARDVPLGRFGRPDEVAGIVAFLAGDRGSYITGASIDVAGGLGQYL